MKATVHTIYELLPSTRGNITELARVLGCDRATIYKYMHDINGEFHSIVNGKLFVKPGLKGRHTRDKR